MARLPNLEGSVSVVSDAGYRGRGLCQVVRTLGSGVSDRASFTLWRFCSLLGISAHVLRFLLTFWGFCSRLRVSAHALGFLLTFRASAYVFGFLRAFSADQSQRQGQIHCSL